MFDLDKWQEVLNTLKHNKLRAILTGFSVAWGIFMLIILLGSGIGLENGVRNQFRGSATNSIFLWPGVTSQAYQGYKEGRFIRITNNDVEATKKDNKEISKLSSRFRIWSNNTVTYNKFYGTYELCNVNPESKEIDNITIKEGRFLNEVDIKELRKVAVIGTKANKELFRGKSSLGEYVKISSVSFKVVGVYESQQDQENGKIYMPITTGQTIFGQGNRVEDMGFTISNITAKQSEELEKEIREQYAERHHFAPDDNRALNMYNNFKQYMQFQSLFDAIRLFIWIIGIGTIIAGIVGVSNIMLIVVRERTREIGIRKAIGASPFSVVSQILAEAIIITTIAGYVGLVLGVGLLEVLKPLFTNPDSFFLNPEANFKVAVSATLVLIISGTLAGLIPARRAASIRPIEALRDE